jgi:(S)-citramalyl-CoA lyase
MACLHRTFSSLLFVPGDRPDRIGKARASAADLVCVDLEDAVADGAKEQARDGAVTLAGEGDPRLVIRINRVASRHGIADLHALAERPPATVLIPMCEEVAELRIVRAALGEEVALVPLVETVAGLNNAGAIAAAPGVSAIMFGGGDLSAELGVALAWEPLLTARSLLVMAAAAARVPAIDVPFVGLDDAAGLEEECRRARALGFRAKAAIHPAQLGAIHDAFRPTDTEREEARAALRAFGEGGGGAVRWNGRLLEAPMIARLKEVAGELSDA